MISDRDVIRACRDAQACMTPPSSLEALRRRSGATWNEAASAMVRAEERGLIEWQEYNLDPAWHAARPTEAGLRLLRESDD